MSRRAAARSERAEESPPTPLELRQDDLSVPDLHDEDARLVLSALLAGRAIFLEADRPVDTRDVDLPQAGLDGLGVGSAS